MHGSAFRRRWSGASGVLDRRDDVVIRSAATEVAAHPVSDLLPRAGVALGDTGGAGHDLPRRAITALERIALDERRLERMEFVALRETLDRRDLAAFDERGERQAGLHALAVHADRAGAALPEAAALLRARQMQMLAQRIEQRRARIELQSVLAAVHAQQYVDGNRRRRGAL